MIFVQTPKALNWNNHNSFIVKSNNSIIVKSSAGSSSMSISELVASGSTFSSISSCNSSFVSGLSLSSSSNVWTSLAAATWFSVVGMQCQQVHSESY